MMNHGMGNSFPQNQRKTNRGLLITALAVLLLLALTAFFLARNTSEKQLEISAQRARECYSAGDYDGALLNLRRALSSDEDNEELLMLMADCYEAMGNYTRALETLRKLNTGNPAIANRIQAVEEKRALLSKSEKLTIAGVEFDRNARAAVLDQKGITDELLKEVTALYALDTLSLCDNELEDIHLLSSLGGLDELNLSGNRVSDISALSALKELRSLTIDRNPVKDCSALKALTNLNYLSLLNTDLTKEQIEELAAALPYCAIRGNPDGEEEIFLGDTSFLADVTELLLSGKGIRDLSALSDCRQLKILDISNNEITDLQPLMNLQNLESLNISGNHVSDLRPLIGMPSLTKLDASSNMITETTAVGAIHPLLVLRLNNNAIIDFSGLKKLTSLSTLELRNTGISDADLTELLGLKHLHNLDLTENSGLTDRAIGQLKSSIPACSIATPDLIYEVDFSGHLVHSDEKTLSFPSCGITSLSGLERMEKLEDLDLSGNELINLFSFEITPSRFTLRKLNLSGNRIQSVTSLTGLTALEELNLSGNLIESVVPLAQLTGLKRLNLSGNPIPDESIAALRQALPECQISF